VQVHLRSDHVGERLASSTDHRRGRLVAGALDAQNQPASLHGLVVLAHLFIIGEQDG
jgi:hypothetical protein